MGPAASVQHLTYGWHPYGELEHRTDEHHDQLEAFHYDDLRRLTQATVTRGAEKGVVEVAYDTLGNILGKSDVGSYAYEDGRLLAYGTGVPVLLEHDDRGNVITHGEESLEYTPFDELRQLTEHGETLHVRYDAEGDRFSRHAVKTGDHIVDARGLYERRFENGALTLTYRVPAHGRIVAQIVRTPGLAGTWLDAVESLHDDHLGSTHVVTDETGAELRTVAYDPWGQARDGNDWLALIDAEALDDLGLGFTGHPARLDADLVDMGGRSYHPRLGRFFSPDPLVADPLDAQSYNRYAYVLNRPLLFTDPTGYAPQGVGGSDVGGNPQNLPRSCVDGNDCYRFIVVADPDGASSLDQWNRTLQWFESQNGPGQGGPGVGTNHPYSAGGVRHGTDAAQPGGSPSFTIAVTEDMCAEIAACSGGQTKRGPVYIWHADIDEGARIALDVGSDFIPGVAQAKTAYDALTRIQNGEDPVDVLMAAGGDAALGLIPGLKATKKVAKAIDKAEDVADAAGDVKAATGKAFSSGRAPHTANVTVYRNGDVAHAETLSSGNMTATEAALGFPKSSLATHTEARAAGIPLQRGDTMIIHGQYPPCPSCKGAMNKAAVSAEAEIHYVWGSQTWSAGGG